MPTLNKEICQNIMANGGYYTSPDGEKDPHRVVRILTYDNMFDGGETWAAVYEHEDYNRYDKSAACCNVTTRWTAKAHDKLLAEEAKEDQEYGNGNGT
ncbi:MAG: hypothetical protein AB7F19_07530 [Candidatus Babeliales bacterium]